MAVIGATELQPVNILGSYVQGLEMGRANQLAQAQAAAAQRKEQREALKFEEDILTQRATRRKTEEDILTGRVTRRKSEVDLAAAELDREIKGAQQVADYVGVAKDQRSWTQLRNQAQQMGLDVTNVPERFDPLYTETLRDSSLGYARYLENQRQQATLRVQQGQLQQSRERLAFDKDKENWQRQNPEFEVKDTAQGLLAVNKRTGAVKPIIYNGQVVTGAAKSSDPRVDEQNTAFNAKRVLNSAQRITSVIQRNPEAMSAGALEAAARGVPLIGEGAAAIIRSEDRQIVEQNYEGIIDALLFMATGAAYNKEQRAATINEIKPLFTDKAGALDDKRGKLMEYIEAAKIKSGRAWTPELDNAMKVVLGMYGMPKGKGAGAGDAVPAGVDPLVWSVMTPEEKALWQK